MDLLARREHTLHELRDKLHQRFNSATSKKNPYRSFSSRRNSRYGDRAKCNDIEASCPDPEESTLTDEQREQLAELIDLVLQQLVDENLQSDDRFVESFINGRKAKGHGPQRISRDLSQKRVDSMLVEKYLDEQDEQWYELALAVYRKKFGEGEPGDYKEKARRMRFMQQRGFPFWMIESVLSNA